MTISHPLFDQDKNYILKEVQADSKASLLTQMVRAAKETYLSKYNPLGLEDDTVKAIQDCDSFSIEHFESFYWELAGIFRYRIGSNQLEFIFSGKSHYEKYQDDWNEAFEIWLEEFLKSKYFIRAVLEMSILYPQKRVALLAKDRMKVYLSQYFCLRVYKYRGIVPIEAA